MLGVRTEIQHPRLWRAKAALSNPEPLPKIYRRKFRTWCALAVPVLLGMACVFALMIWQPRLE